MLAFKNTRRQKSGTLRSEQFAALIRAVQRHSHFANAFLPKRILYRNVNYEIGKSRVRFLLKRASVPRNTAIRIKLVARRKRAVVNMVSQVIIIGMVIFVGTGLLTALLQFLWNITVPQISSLKVITFRQVFRLLLIGSLLTSGGFVHLLWR